MLVSCDHYLSVIGVLTVTYLVAKCYFHGKRLWNESLSSRIVDFRKFGEWAVVTGASDGIGKAISVELAKCGMNVVLISRTRSKLEKLSLGIEDKYKVQTKIIAIDFTQYSDIYDIIKREIESLDIAVLVNNVAVAQMGDHTPILGIPNLSEFTINICNVNFGAMAKMTELVLPNMVAKRSGIIVNVSSLMGSAVFPTLSHYSASKSAVNKFTEAMRQEYKSKGVIFQCITPGLTSTNMTGVDKSFLVPSAEEYGRYVIHALGKSSYTNTSVLSHNVFQILINLIPEYLIIAGLRKGIEKSLANKSKG